MDLLLHECNGDQHYSTIKNFSLLIRGQLSNHGHAIYCCKKCLHAYSTKELLAADAVDCCHVQRMKFPLDPRCHFTNIQKQLTAPFVVYEDFKSILKLVNEGVNVTITRCILHQTIWQLVLRYRLCTCKSCVGCIWVLDNCRHDVYLQLDVLLLVDFFEKFCRTCLDFYSLDPLHYTLLLVLHGMLHFVCHVLN